MLRNFRAVFKGNQTPMTVVMLIVLLGLVAYLAPNQSRVDSPDNVVARVYGRDILRRDMERTISELARRMNSKANLESMMPYLQTQALRQLMNQKLMEELADRHDIVVTDEEIRAGLESRLRQYPVFVGENNQLRPAAEIDEVLKQSGITLIQWEREIRDQMLAQKLMEQAAAVVPVDEAWINQENRIRNEKITFESATLTPDINAIQDPGDGPLSAFLKAGGARFQVGPRRVIQYVSVDKAHFGDALKVNEADLKAAYESKKAQYQELKASHILFKAEGDAQVAEALKKAQELRPKLLAGQDFNKTASELSQDPSAKDNKGDLGWFKSGAMVKPFEDAAMALKIGEISQPVKSSFGIHLIKLEGRREKSFEDVKSELQDQLAQERFNTRAKDKLEQLRKRSGERGDLGPAARALSLKTQTSLPFLEEGGTTIEGLPDSGLLVSQAFKMKVGEVSKVLKAGDQYVVFRVQEERPIAIPALNEIRSKVLAAWKLEEARKKALERAKTVLQSGNLTDLGTPTSKENVTIQSLGELGQQAAIRKALLDTNPDALTPILWTPDGQVWIARIKGRVPAEALTFEKRQSLVKEIQSTTSQKNLTAELEDLDRKGRLRPGFSSLWGRFGGIWTNNESIKKGREDVPDLGED